VNAQKPRTKNTATKTMITSVTNPPPMYMISLPFEIGPGPPSVVAAVPQHRKRKKPTWRNTRRYSITSAYSTTGPPAEPSCSSSSHPTAIHCKARNGECNSPRLVKRELNKSEKITWETEACSAGTCRLHHSKCRNFSLASYWESHPLAKGRNALNRDSPTNLSDD